MTDLFIIRGLPGSGKSMFARTIASSMDDTVHFEADMFFERDGEYRFDATKLREAHAWCLRICNEALALGFNVVVSNTFSQRWEYEPYVFAAMENGAMVHIMTMNGKFENVHSVPDETIKRMKARWEH